MSRPAFNAAGSSRLSKGPLYSARELVLAERFLAAQGYSRLTDIQGAADIRVFAHKDAPENRQVVMSLGGGDASGIVYFTDSATATNETAATTVWDLAKKQAKTMSLVDRLLRR